MFQLTKQEVIVLRSQIVTLKDPEEAVSRSQFVTLKQGKNIKYRPYAFTEQGVAMLSSVLQRCGYRVVAEGVKGDPIATLAN